MKHFVLDIHTVAAPGVEDSFYPGWAQKKGARSLEDALNRAGMHPEFAMVCAVAVVPVDILHAGKKILTARTLEEESSMLEELSNILRDPDIILVGHNIKQFDVPFLAKRYLAQGFVIPSFIKKAITGANVIDTMQVLACGGNTVMSLRAAAYMLEIEDEKAIEKNSSVYDMFQECRMNEIEHSVDVDAEVTVEVFKQIKQGGLV